MKTVIERCIYEYFHDVGQEYGPAFRGLRQLSYNDNGVASGKVEAFR